MVPQTKPPSPHPSDPSPTKPASSTLPLLQAEGYGLSPRPDRGGGEEGLGAESWGLGAGGGKEREGRRGWANSFLLDPLIPVMCYGFEKKKKPQAF